MDGNYTNGGQPYPGGDPQWDNKQWNNGQWQGQQQYWQGGNPQWQAPQPKSQVKDVFCNLLLVIFILQIVVSLVMLNDILSVMQFSGYRSIPGTALFRRVCGVQRDRVCALDRDDRIFGT